MGYRDTLSPHRAYSRAASVIYPASWKEALSMCEFHAMGDSLHTVCSCPSTTEFLV